MPVLVRWLAAAALFTAPLAAWAEEAFAQGTDGEVLLLLNLTRGDARQLEFDGDTATDTIRIVRDADGVRYEFAEHRLSCGTLMTGSIRESTRDGKTFARISFTLARNPWHIRSLEGELPADAIRIHGPGTVLVDGRALKLP